MLLLTLQENWTITFFLHDAVYLYLRTINQMLAEGNADFSSGQCIRNKTIGQRFVGRFINGLSFYLGDILAASRPAKTALWILYGVVVFLVLVFAGDYGLLTLTAMTTTILFRPKTTIKH